MDYLASPIPTGVIALPADLRLAICVFDKQISDNMAFEAAEDHSAIDGRSGVLLGVYGGYGSTLPSQPPRTHGFCAT